MEPPIHVEGTLCKYATASVDTPQRLPTRSFSSTGYFLFVGGIFRVPVPYRFFDSYRVFFDSYRMPWHGMLPDAAAMEDYLDWDSISVRSPHYVVQEKLGRQFGIGFLPRGDGP